MTNTPIPDTAEGLAADMRAFAKRYEDTPDIAGPRRVQLSRKKGWRMPENTVKVDRSTKWGNPYLVERQSGEVWEPETQAWRRGLHSVRLLGGPYWYRAYLTQNDATALACQMFADHIAPAMDLTPLRGKNLACWCAGPHCHADVLLELANRHLEGVAP